MNRLRMLLCLLLVGLLTVPLAGGAIAASDGPVEVVLWHTLAEHHQAALNKIISDFNASQSRVTVVAQPQPYTDFYPKLMQAVRNGIGPDFVTAFPTEAVNYMTDNLLVDYSVYLDDAEIGIPGFRESISEGLYAEITQWGDGSYLFPALATGEVFFYNKTLYDELNLSVPTTWKELEENSRIIYEAKGVPGFGTDSEIDTFQCLLRQNGSEYIDVATKTVAFNNEIGLEQLTWFGNCVKEGIFRLVGEDGYFSNPFGSGAVASYIGSSAGVNYVKAAVGDKFEVGCAPIPQAGKVPYISSWGSFYITFKSNEAKERGAYEFLKYLTSAEVLPGWAIAFGGAPVYADSLNSPDFKRYQEENMAAKALSAQVDIIGFLPSLPGSAAVRNHIEKMVQSVALGIATPQEALDACEAACNADLM